MSLAVAEKIITDALAADPRTANLRVSRSGTLVTLTDVASADKIVAQTNEDVANGRALIGTPIQDKYDTRWKGIIVDVKQTNYIVERTSSRSGRGQSGKRFRMPMNRCELDPSQVKAASAA
tara:strand:+ start:179489 stop:179851 length:363 start_codon:yes stop_codon:yes gene_type:complete